MTHRSLNNFHVPSEVPGISKRNRVWYKDCFNREWCCCWRLQGTGSSSDIIWNKESISANKSSKYAPQDVEWKEDTDLKCKMSTSLIEPARNSNHFSEIMTFRKPLGCNCLDYTRTQDNGCALNENPLCMLVQYCVSEQLREKGALADVPFISKAVFLQDNLFPGYLLPPKEETNFGTEAGMRLQIKEFFT